MSFLATLDYFEGKRARYVSPIALFLFVVFLSFAAFNMLGAGEALQGGGGGLKAANQAYRDNAAKVQMVETTSGAYYGAGYQDVQNRVPKIDNTQADLDWQPRVSMDDALRGIFEYYRTQIVLARDLMD